MKLAINNARNGIEEEEDTTLLLRPIKMKIPDRMTPLLAEEIGLHLGDGSMNFYQGRGLYQLRGHRFDDKEHYIKIIKHMYKELFDIDINLRDMPSTGVFGFQIWSNELVKFKHEILELPLGKKTNAFIPKIIRSNETLAKSFLRGLFDTDGCIYIENKNGKAYPKVQITSTSLLLMEQARKILENMGFQVSFWTWHREEQNFNDACRICLNGYKMVQKWFYEIGSSNPKHTRKYNKLNGPAGI